MSNDILYLLKNTNTVGNIYMMVHYVWLKAKCYKTSADLP